MKALIGVLLGVTASAQIAPVRVIDGNWKTTALRADKTSVYIKSERGTLKVTDGVKRVLSTDPVWSGDVTRDDPRFKGMGLLVTASHLARVKVRPKDAVSLVLLKSGPAEQWNFDSKNTAVLKQTRRQLEIQAPSGFPVMRPRVLSAALDGSTVYVLYAAWLPGNVMAVGRFSRVGTSYVRKEFLIHVPKDFHLFPHLAASNGSLWIGNEGQLVAEYRLK